MKDDGLYHIWVLTTGGVYLVTADPVDYKESERLRKLIQASDNSAIAVREKDEEEGIFGSAFGEEQKP